MEATTRFETGNTRTRPAQLAWQARIFGAYFVQFLKMRLAYRMDFFIDTLAVGFSLLIQLAVLSVLFGKVSALDGWSYPQVLFIYGFSLVPLGLFNLVSVNLYGFADEYLIGGRFDRVLLRPVGSLAQVIFESFNVSGLNEILLGLAVMIHAGMKLGLDFGVTDVLALLVLAPGAALVYLGVFLGITAVSFWFEDKMGLAPPVYNLIRFSRYPLTIYSLPVRIFLTFVLPFAWVAFYPAAWFVGGPGLAKVAMATPLVGVVVFGGAALLWRRGVRNYVSTGS
ncbi:MAG: ABC-2 family transporter protein [bacterium]|nr:ABC-2 family transporter protein [bacterium]MBK7769900.1 ABC-2 family transporter protein [bacterium]MBK9473686.1 ABC-2 family transporter protein [bacterium]